MKQRSALTLALLVVCILLIPFSPGLNIAPFISLTVLVAWMREKTSNYWFYFCALLIIATLSYTTTQVLYPSDTSSPLLNAFITLEKPVLIVIFGILFFFTYPTKIYNIGGILALCAILFLFEEFVITATLSSFPPYNNNLIIAENPYIDFSPGREAFEAIITQTKERAKDIANETGLVNFESIINKIAAYQATLNIIASLFYILLFFIFLGKSFQKIRFTFVSLQIPKYITYFLLFFWFIALLEFQNIIQISALFLHFLYSAVIVFCVIHFFQGAAVIFFKLISINTLLKRQIENNSNFASSGINRKYFGRISFYAILALLPLLFIGNPIGLVAIPIVVCLIGIMDAWFNYRKF